VYLFSAGRLEKAKFSAQRAKSAKQRKRQREFAAGKSQKLCESLRPSWLGGENDVLTSGSIPLNKHSANA
jgi:hypothetical protein